MGNVFELAPRATDTVEIGGEPVEVYALDLDKRLQFGNTGEKTPGWRLAWIAANGCPDLAGCSADEVLQRLDSAAISAIAAKVMELSGMGDAQKKTARRSAETPT